MREGIAIESTPVRPSEKSNANWRSTHRGLACSHWQGRAQQACSSSTLHSLYLKHSQFLPLGHRCQSCKTLGPSSGSRSRSSQMNPLYRPTLSRLWNRAGWRNPQTDATLVSILSRILKTLFHVVPMQVQWDFVWIKRKTYWQNSEGGICVCRRAGHPGHWYEQRAWGSQPGHTHGEKRTEKHGHTLGCPKGIRGMMEKVQKEVFCLPKFESSMNIYFLHPSTVSSVFTVFSKKMEVEPSNRSN